MNDGQSHALPEQIRWLLTPGALGPGHTAPELIQTHISFVILAGDRAYKLKKPRDFGFLDFRTLEARRLDSERELRLNQRLTQGVYLAVKPLVLTACGGFALGGDGDAVDYVVVMRRLDQEQMLDRLVEHGSITAEQVRSLAHHLARYYRRADTSPHISSFGHPRVLRANWQENFDQTRPFIGRTISADDFATIEQAVGRDLERLAPLFEQRMAEGWVRDCHGDLRLSAVCYDGGVQVYDCIEFNERFRFGDVAADVAFLMMDFDAHGRPDLAQVFLRAMVEALADPTLPSMIPFYLCYRAFVRGKVDSFQLDEPEVDAAHKAAAAAAARQRFAQALGYAAGTAPFSTPATT